MSVERARTSRGSLIVPVAVAGPPLCRRPRSPRVANPSKPPPRRLGKRTERRESVSESPAVRNTPTRTPCGTARRWASESPSRALAAPSRASTLDITPQPRAFVKRASISPESQDPLRAVSRRPRRPRPPSRASSARFHTKNVHRSVESGRDQVLKLSSV